MSLLQAISIVLERNPDLRSGKQKKKHEGLAHEVLQWYICRMEAWFVADVDKISLKGWDQLVLLVGAKLQHIIATLAFENADVTEFNTWPRLRPRDELFWFKKPELLLSLIHFVLFQWQFGYNSCFIRNHLLVYIRLIIGFAGQFLCSYSTLPLYALVTQMGTNYKAALIPHRIRETIHGWKKSAKRKRRLGIFNDDSTIHTDTSTVLSLEEDEHQMYESIENGTYAGIELQPTSTVSTSPAVAADENSSQVGVGTPLLRPSTSLSSTMPLERHRNKIPRSYSMPSRRE